MPVLKITDKDILADGLTVKKFKALVNYSGVQHDNNIYETPYNRMDYLTPLGLANSFKVLTPKKYMVKLGNPKILLRCPISEGLKNLVDNCMKKRFNKNLGYIWQIDTLKISIEAPNININLLELLVGYLETRSIAYEIELYSRKISNIEIFRYRPKYKFSISDFKLYDKIDISEIQEVLKFYRYQYVLIGNRYEVAAPYWRWESDKLCNLWADFMRYHGVKRCITGNKYDFKYLQKPKKNMTNILHEISIHNRFYQLHVNYIVASKSLHGVGHLAIENPFSAKRNAVCNKIWPELLNNSFKTLKNHKMPLKNYAIASGYGSEYENTSYACLIIDLKFQLSQCHNIIKNLRFLGFKIITVKTGKDLYDIILNGVKIGKIFSIKLEKYIATIMHLVNLKDLEYGLKE